MEENNNKTLNIMKRQRTSASAERTYIFIQTLYLTIEVMADEDSSRKEIVQCMVETTLAAKVVGRFEKERTKTQRKDMNVVRLKMISLIRPM